MTEERQSLTSDGGGRRSLCAINKMAELVDSRIAELMSLAAQSLDSKSSEDLHANWATHEMKERRVRAMTTLFGGKNDGAGSTAIYDEDHMSAEEVTDLEDLIADFMSRAVNTAPFEKVEIERLKEVHADLKRTHDELCAKFDQTLENWNQDIEELKQCQERELEHLEKLNETSEKLRVSECQREALGRSLAGREAELSCLREALAQDAPHEQVRLLNALEQATCNALDQEMLGTMRGRQDESSLHKLENGSAAQRRTPREGSGSPASPRVSGRFRMVSAREPQRLVRAPSPMQRMPFTCGAFFLGSAKAPIGSGQFSVGSGQLPVGSRSSSLGGSASTYARDPPAWASAPTRMVSGQQTVPARWTLPARTAGLGMYTPPVSPLGTFAKVPPRSPRGTTSRAVQPGEIARLASPTLRATPSRTPRAGGAAEPVACVPCSPQLLSAVPVLAGTPQSACRASPSPVSTDGREFC